jgi:hypothetical protein
MMQLRGQHATLHSCVWDIDGNVHIEPPHHGTSAIVRVCMPGSHVVLHAVHAPQPPHGTGQQPSMASLAVLVCQITVPALSVITCVDLSALQRTTSFDRDTPFPLFHNVSPNGPLAAPTAVPVCQTTPPASVVITMLPSFCSVIAVPPMSALGEAQMA